MIKREEQKNIKNENHKRSCEEKNKHEIKKEKDKTRRYYITTEEVFFKGEQ